MTKHNNNQEELIFALAFDGNGGAQRLSWEEAKSWNSKEGVLWLHLNYTKDKTKNWLINESGIEPLFAKALCADDTRPRSFSTRNRVFLNLRGMNFNPDADDDTTSLRLWVEENRVLTFRRNRLFSISDVYSSLESQQGPQNSADFLVHIIDRLVYRTGIVLESIEDQIDTIEEEILDSENTTVRKKILQLRQQVIGLRRYLAPQRDVLVQLPNEKLEWLGDHHRLQLQEIGDRAMRSVEELDEAREKLSVMSDEFSTQLTERMNRNMYLLSLISAIFLPLGFVTGLLGINVGGIPAAESKQAFWVVLGLLVLLGIFQWQLFKRLKWI